MFTSEQIIRRLADDVAKRGSQTKLAEAIGVSKTYISDILKGKKEPSGRVLLYLGVERILRYVKRNGK